MGDSFFSALTVGFFAVSVAYTYGCEKLEERNTTDAIWIGRVTALVLVYLLYALLVPEKF